MEKQATQLQAYQNIEKLFESKEYSKGISYPKYDNLINICEKSLRNGECSFKDLPSRVKNNTNFFIFVLSEGPYTKNKYKDRKDVVDYVKSNIEKFDRDFFKNYIETDWFSLYGDSNAFEIMPIDYIDEEMVLCAMKKALSNFAYLNDKRCGEWFYTVARRKPELLTEDLYILAARCFAENIDGNNKLLSITPEEYRTEEFYWEMCIDKDTPVLQNVPSNAISDNFLFALLNRNAANIRVFTEEFLERETCMQRFGKVKFWQVALILDGLQIANIPLNEERIQFFVTMYDEKSEKYAKSFSDSLLNYFHTNDLIMHETLKNGKIPVKYALLPTSYCSMKLDSLYSRMGIEFLDPDGYIAVLPEYISLIQDVKKGNMIGYYIYNKKIGKKILHFRKDFRNNHLETDAMFVEFEIKACL